MKVSWVNVFAFTFSPELIQVKINVHFMNFKQIPNVLEISCLHALHNRSHFFYKNLFNRVAEELMFLLI